MDKIIYHIDVNSAYLSMSSSYMLSKGEISFDLTKIPSAIGGDIENRTGIILAASIPAKAKGIKTGETIYSALQKCPELKIYPPRYDIYLKSNKALVNILYDYTPKVQVFSIDEAFMDVSHFRESYIDKAIEIKQRIKNELGFTVNIGISNNKLLAKQASDFLPKDSIHTLFLNEIKEKLWPKPVEDLFGVGRSTLPKLNRLNIYTIGDLANYDINILKYNLKSHGIVIYNYANGKDSSEVSNVSNIGIKGIGNSTTLKRDVSDRESLCKTLLALTENVSMRLREEKSLCELVSVSLKSDSFIRYSHQKNINITTDCTETIYKFIRDTFNEMWTGEPIRQIGVIVGKLSPNNYHQTNLFNEKELEKKRKLDSVIDDLRKKHGKYSIQRSTFLTGDIKSIEGGTTGDYTPKISSLL